MVWTHSLTKKCLLGVGGEWVGGRPNLMYSPGPGLWSLVLGPSGPDLGPGPRPELDNLRPILASHRNLLGPLDT